jgi:hypothetical protein
VENTQQEIEAKTQATPAQARAQAVRTAVREQEKTLAQHVVNDDEQWKRFQQQMRSGGVRSGIALKNQMNDLLQSRAQDLQSAGVQNAQPMHRGPSIADFASTLIRGEDGGSQRRMSMAVSGISPNNSKRKSFSSASGHSPNLGSQRRRYSMMGSISPNNTQRSFISATENNPSTRTNHSLSASSYHERSRRINCLDAENKFSITQEELVRQANLIFRKSTAVIKNESEEEDE